MEQRIFRKNEVICVTITDYADTGEGIGKADGFPFFVKHAVIGDVADVIVTSVKKTYGYARIRQLIRPSADRRDPVCPAWKRCGGCQFQNVSYPAQLDFKTNKVRQAIKRIGGLPYVPVLPCIGSTEEWGYRNKAQYPVGKDRDGILCSGFYAGRTHEIIPNECCFLTPSEFNDILKTILRWMQECRIPPYDEKTAKGIVRHVFLRKGMHTGEIGVCLICNTNRLKHSEELIRALSPFPQITGISFSPNTKASNVILGETIVPLSGDVRLHDRIGEVSYAIHPLSFYQINNAQTERLYECVRKYAALSAQDHVWDLYCGIGSISLYLAKDAGFVTGIEVVERAVEDARINADANGIHNARFFAGDVSSVFPELYKKSDSERNVIVVDPPRKGCDEATLHMILDAEPDKIVYVSCNPSTLARDLKVLCAGGYKAVEVQPFDMFPQTAHVETVCLLYHQKRDFISVPYEPSDSDYLRLLY